MGPLLLLSLLLLSFSHLLLTNDDDEDGLAPPNPSNILLSSREMTLGLLVASTPSGQLLMCGALHNPPQGAFGVCGMAAGGSS